MKRLIHLETKFAEGTKLYQITLDTDWEVCKECGAPKAKAPSTWRVVIEPGQGGKPTTSIDQINFQLLENEDTPYHQYIANSGEMYSEEDMRDFFLTLKEAETECTKRNKELEA